MVSKILENVVAIHAYVKRHDARLDKIEKLLQENYSGYKCEKNKVFDDEFIVLFPMKDIEAITSVDDKIKTDPVFESQMVIHFFFQLTEMNVHCLYYRELSLRLLEELIQKILRNVCCTDYLQMNCQQNVHGQALNQISD